MIPILVLTIGCIALGCEYGSRGYFWLAGFFALGGICALAGA